MLFFSLAGYNVMVATRRQTHDTYPTSVDFLSRIRQIVMSLCHISVFPVRQMVLILASMYAIPKPQSDILTLTLEGQRVEVAEHRGNERK
jgi:hypothetical protein